MRSIHIQVGGVVSIMTSLWTIIPDLECQSSRDGCGAGVTVFHHLKRLREALPAILVSTVFTGQSRPFELGCTDYDSADWFPTGVQQTGVGTPARAGGGGLIECE